MLWYARFALFVVGLMVAARVFNPPMFRRFIGDAGWTRSVGHGRSGVILWASLILVALIEPALQVWTAVSGAPIVGAPHTYALRAVAYDGLHVFAINLCQLLIFRRYDFVSMYALRLIYYVIWHMAWGHVRLQLLF